MLTETLEIKPKNAAKLDRLRKLLQRDLKLVEQMLLQLRGSAGDETRKRRTTPFDFNARVVVSPNRKTLRSIRGKTGTVLGRAPGQGNWIYTVFIDDRNECWSLAHNELKPSAKPAPKMSADPVRHLRVRVDKQGRGRLTK